MCRDMNAAPQFTHNVRSLVVQLVQISAVKLPLLGVINYKEHELCNNVTFLKYLVR